LLKIKTYQIKFLFCFVLILAPWFLLGINTDMSPEKITSDLRFYEINTCEISIVSFLMENPNVIYQDHYKIRFNNYSSMRCFGMLTGIDQINHQFYISVGTNSFLNLIYQTILWCFVLSFIKKKEDISEFSIAAFISVLISSGLITAIIYIEERFYVKSLYFHDFYSQRYLIQIWLLIFLVAFLSYYFLSTRDSKLIKYIPYLYLLIGAYSGMNFNFFSIGLITLGLIRIFKEKKLWINKYYLLVLLFIWTNNAYKKDFFVNPDKLRGFTSSIFNELSVLVYGIIITLIINGLFFIFNSSKNFKIKNYLYNSMFTGFLILIFGYIGSTMPFFNFFNYYFFGLNKYGINRSNIFGLNEWGERLAWRGHFPSAETVGEFFAITLLIYAILILKNKIEFKTVDGFLILTLFIGLLSSNNRAAILALLFCLFIFIIRENLNIKYSKFIKYLIVLLLFTVVILLIGINNFIYPIDYLQDSVLNDGKYYSLDNDTSVALDYLIKSKESNNFIYFIFGLISMAGFFVNRSELWGIFVARFDPELQEFIFGSGLYNLGQLYGEININPTYSFLLPHSSLLSFLLFIGILNVTILIGVLFIKIFKNTKKDENIFIYLAIFVFLNILKSDSLLYFSSFVNYLFIFYFASKKDKRLI
tara:strand:- start:15149 stop:17086 length:1938 start_codon:yes stop_codon:yes gene_type:complete